MKKQFLFHLVCLIAFISVLLPNATLLSAPARNAKMRVDPELAFCVKAIETFPEGQALISNILSEGPLNIVITDNDVARAFSACWDSESRTICISLDSRPTQGEVLASLLFELQNALVSSQFDKLDQRATLGTISKNDYIHSMEYLEYINSINAAKIAKIGIQKGIFPECALLPTYSSFDEHFYYQKISGHSDVFGKNYDLFKNHL